MASFPVMLFLITLLLSSIVTEGETQKGSTISADCKANIKAVLKKIDCQSEEDIIEALEKMLCASHQDETSFEDLANADQNMLGVTTVLTSLRKCCAHKHQVQPGNFSSKADRPEGTGVGQQQDDFDKNLIDMLGKFLDKVANTLVSRKRN